ncbi:hypothetical protein BHM03_00013096 [Ensete ventricosum]|nr:hypothetical protein BHM03_00013096 [Ensete ventricosum]
MSTLSGAEKTGSPHKAQFKLGGTRCGDRSLVRLGLLFIAISSLSLLPNPNSPLPRVLLRETEERKGGEQQFGLVEEGGDDGKKMASLVSRQGRQLQRYSKTGSRLVVGYACRNVVETHRTGGVSGVCLMEKWVCLSCRCIPYKFNTVGGGDDDDLHGSMEVLVISSPKGNGLLFPKVTVAEAREGCRHPWMREALERLVRRLSSSSSNDTTASAP